MHALHMQHGSSLYMHKVDLCNEYGWKHGHHNSKEFWLAVSVRSWSDSFNVRSVSSNLSM